ncbi:MAG TPA: transcription termination factor Rho [Kribbellaceae bacterium]
MTETVDTSTGVAGDQSAPDTGAAPTRRRRSGGGLEGMLLPELKQLAGSLGIRGAGALRKGQLIEAIKAAQGGSAPGGSGGNGEGGGTSRATQPTLDEAGDTPPARPVEITAPREEAPAVRDTSDAERRTASGRRDENGQGAESGENRQGGDAGRRGESGQDNRQEARQDNRRGERENRQDGEGRDRGRQQDGQNRDRGGENRAEGQQNRDRQDRGDNQGNRGGGDRNDNRGEEAEGRRRRRRGRDRGRDRDGGGGQGGRGGRGGRERFDVEPVVTEDDVLVPAAGILDVLDNYAFVRTGGYLPGPNDVYVSLAMVKKYGLRKGDAITGAVRQPREGERKEKFNPLVRIDTVNGSDPEAARHRPEFQKLVPLYATERLRLETEPQVLTTRIIDIMAPIGKGNRGLIVSPAKAGKTMILQSIANAITTNNPEVHLMVVLVDERPEEVTDMQRTVKGEVIASTFDRPADDHTTVAELAIERAKRLVELGHDVVVMLDSITRLGRAYNLAAPASGRILSGGVDSSALYPPKRFFGAARNIEDGGSLTILATALIETGSKMDEVIFEEFKGTGNMELRLRREFADKRIFPAIDVDASSTRREELLMSKDELAVTWKLRRVLSALDGQAALELLINKLKDTKSNIEFLLQVNQSTPTTGSRRTSDGD